MFGEIGCGRELPFCKHHIFGNCVDIWRAYGDRCRGSGNAAKLGFDSSGEVEAASYVAVESPFTFSLCNA